MRRCKCFAGYWKRISPLGIFARSLWQMTPMSPFIRRLKEGPWPSHVRFSSIYSKTDRMTPFPAALLETGGLPYLANVEVTACAHREFLVKKKVYDAILAELRAAEAASAGGGPAPLKLVPGAGGA